ncbi:hypothetical protein HDU93_004485 [Gonapodya sp. JEL0774]|nr:hypothetical protein HDU93_004485 [Gonapodya sp. JEL0774]
MPRSFTLPALLLPPPPSDHPYPTAPLKQLPYAHIWLFDDVKKPKAIRQAIIKGTTPKGVEVPQSAIVDARMINESLRTFGVRDDSPALLVLVLSPDPSPPPLTETFSAFISPTELELTAEHLARFSDTEGVKSVFRVTGSGQKRDSRGVEVGAGARDEVADREWLMGEVVGGMALKGYS